MTYYHILTRFGCSKAKPELANDLFETHSFPHTAPGRNNCKANAVNCFLRNENPSHIRLVPGEPNTAFFSSKIQARCKAKPSSGWIILTKHDTTDFFREQGVVLYASSKINSAFKIPNFFTPSLEKQLQSKRRNKKQCYFHLFRWEARNCILLFKNPKLSLAAGSY